MPARIRQGQVVWAWVSDSQGRNRKCRPLVVLNHDEEIGDGLPLFVVCCTTTFPMPPPDDAVLLPWHRDGHPPTKLRTRTVACCRWLEEIQPSDVVTVGGTVGAKHLRMILERLPADENDDQP